MYSRQSSNPETNSCNSPSGSGSWLPKFVAIVHSIEYSQQLAKSGKSHNARHYTSSNKGLHMPLLLCAYTGSKTQVELLLHTVSYSLQRIIMSDTQKQKGEN